MAKASETAGTGGGGIGARGILLGLVGGIACGGAAFGLLYSGLLDPARIIGASDPAAMIEPLEPIGFVALEPIVISLPRGASARHLRFLGQLEVVPDHAAEVVALMPRIQDVLNTYLRAVDLADLEQPGATVWMRAQMLRRVQVVTGEGRVRDLLISEFVFN